MAYFFENFFDSESFLSFGNKEKAPKKRHRRRRGHRRGRGHTDAATNRAPRSRGASKQALSSTPSVAVAVASLTTALARGPPGEGSRAELLRITCEETFLRRQQRRLLHSIFAAEHGEDADAIECSPEVEVASGPAPTGLQFPRSHYLVSGWIDNLIVSLFLG